jgi:hypothetical protein
MTAAHTTALELLGKTVSFEYVRHVQITDKSSIDFREKLSGIVTSVVVHMNSSPEISIDDGDFYDLSKLLDFSLN